MRSGRGAGHLRRIIDAIVALQRAARSGCGVLGHGTAPSPWPPWPCHHRSRFGPKRCRAPASFPVVVSRCRLSTCLRSRAGPRSGRRCPPVPERAGGAGTGLGRGSFQHGHSRPSPGRATSFLPRTREPSRGTPGRTRTPFLSPGLGALGSAPGQTRSPSGGSGKSHQGCFGRRLNRALFI